MRRLNGRRNEKKFLFIILTARTRTEWKELNILYCEYHVKNEIRNYLTKLNIIIILN